MPDTMVTQNKTRESSLVVDDRENGLFRVNRKALTASVVNSRDFAKARKWADAQVLIMGMGFFGAKSSLLEDGFITADGEPLETDLSVWAAGIRAPEFLSELGLATERNHQIKVNQTLQSLDDERIFAFGDCASCPQPDDKRVPPRAQAAHQQATHCYHNLRAAMDGKPLKPFVYHDRGSLISLAHFEAVGSLMRGASARSLFIEGRLAKLFYASLYRMH